MKNYWKLHIQSSLRNRLLVIIIIGIGLLVILFTLSLSVGASKWSINEIWKYILFEDGDSVVGDIIKYVRLPRSIAALLCGAGLGVSGLLLQSALNNGLASPGTIGANSGAGLFIVIAAVVFPGQFIAKPIMAFIGSFVSTFTVFYIARKREASKTTIIMAGIAVGSLLAACSDVLITIYPDSILDKALFFIGNLSNIQGSILPYMIPICMAGICMAFFMATRMNLLLLGDEIAESLGVNVRRSRFILIIIATLLSASAVCIGGIISFVGLIIPHIARLSLGTDHRILVPAVVLGGGLLVTTCDILARVVMAPYEIPVGIFLSFLGAPFFLWLILKKGRRLEI